MGCDIGKGVTRMLTLPGGGSVVGALAPALTAGLGAGGAFSSHPAGNYAPAYPQSSGYVQTYGGAAASAASTKSDNTALYVAGGVLAASVVVAVLLKSKRKSS